MDTSFGKRLIFTELPPPPPFHVQYETVNRCTKFTLPSGRPAEEHIFDNGATADAKCACTKYTLETARNW